MTQAAGPYPETSVTLAAGGRSGMSIPGLTWWAGRRAAARSTT